MDSVYPILFGAAFEGLTALSLGLLIVQALRLPLHRIEARLLGYLVGSAALSLVVFLLTAAWLASAGWFAAVGIGAIGTSLWRGAWRHGSEVTLDPLPRYWRWLFALGLLVYGVFTLAHATAPEISPDGITYHLGTVSRYLRQGRFGWYTTNMYANMPMGIEMLFMYAFAFGKHSAAALVHWQFYLLLPLLLLSFGRRFGFAKGGATAGLLVFMSPVAGIDGASAYVDVATGTVAFGLLYLLLVWEQNRARGLLFAIGILAGFAYACKMTAFPAVPFAAAFVAWKCWRTKTPWFRPAATIALMAAVLIVPWLAKNAIVVGNPFSPFLNRVFPNPNVRISFEEDYRESFRTYYGQIKSPAQIPYEVTTSGAVLCGLLGPIFLLAPIGLIALRWPLGRRVLLAALVFGMAYPSNIGTRFLLIPLPFIALAMGMALSNWRGMAAAVVLFHAFLSWPTVIPNYAHPHAWRLLNFRWKEALRIQKEDDFLDWFNADYKLAKLIEQQVPPHGKVMTFSGLPESYTSRDVVVVYQGGWNNLLGDVFSVGMSEDMQPTNILTYRFPAQKVRRLRLVQTKTSPSIWSLAEIRILNDRAEVERDASWRLRAQPNPWEVQLAFDNCPITRWRAWQTAEPGMFIEIDFGRPVTASAVRVETSRDQDVSARIEAEIEPGNWQKVSDALEPTTVPPIDDSRRLAADDLKRMGVTHLAVANSDWLAEDVRNNTVKWGLTLIGESRNSKLYRLD